MVESKPSDLLKEVEKRSEMLSLRLKSMEKQEENIKSKIEEIQKEILGGMKK